VLHEQTVRTAPPRVTGRNGRFGFEPGPDPSPAASGRLLWQPLRRADLDDLDALLSAIEEHDDLGDRHTPDDLHDTFDAETEPELHCRLGRTANGLLVAYGWNHPLPCDSGPPRIHLSGGVHPDHRRRGCGHALLAWQLDAARSWHARRDDLAGEPLRLVAYLEGDRADQGRLYEDLGLTPVRWFADMDRSLADELPVHADPPGIRVVPLNRKRFEAVRAAHNEAFAGHWGSRPIDARGWEEQLLRPQSRLSWSWVALAEETSEVVGYATNAADEGDGEDLPEGWTDRLGVRPGWRGRGVGRALLTASLRSFAEAGLATAGLGVDSDDPLTAFQIYESLGYVTTHAVVMYARTEAAATPGESPT
jgi:mycothiol synthase